MKRELYGTVIVTYRCNAHCNMCDCFKDPTKPENFRRWRLRILQEGSRLFGKI